MSIQIDPTCRVLSEISAVGPLRIDAFTVITGNVSLGRFVHVGAHCALIGTSGRIVLEDGSGISLGCRLLTGSEGFATAGGITPLMPDELRDVKCGGITLKRCAVVGAGTTILPGVTIGEGAAVGANSLVRRDIPAGEIWSGTPARRIGTRDMAAVQRALEFLERDAAHSLRSSASH